MIRLTMGAAGIYRDDTIKDHAKFVAAEARRDVRAPRQRREAITRKTSSPAARDLRRLERLSAISEAGK
jgi:hypothetical protein